MPETGYAETVGIAENAQIWADSVPDVVVEGWVPTPVAGQRSLDLSPGVGVAAFQRSETVETERVVAPAMAPGALGQWFALTRHRLWLEGSGTDAGQTEFRLIAAGTTTAATPSGPPTDDFRSWLRDEGGNPRENIPGVEYDQLLDWFWWAQASTVPVRFSARRVADSSLPNQGGGGRLIRTFEVPGYSGNFNWAGTGGGGVRAGVAELLIPDPGVPFRAEVAGHFFGGGVDPSMRVDFDYGYGGLGNAPLTGFIHPEYDLRGLEFRSFSSARTEVLTGALTWRAVASKPLGGTADGRILADARRYQVKYFTA